MSVRVRHLSKEYDLHGRDRLQVMVDINLEIQDREFFCILGPSGCGKSTLLRLIAGLERPNSGSIHVDGQSVKGPCPTRGMIFQDHALFPWRTVEENICFGLEIRRESKEKQREIAEHYLELIGLEEFRNSYPHQLSGGMRQRVALARSLALGPSLLLMDESFGALDAQTRSYLQNELVRIWSLNDLTVIFVTHDIEEALLLGDRVAIMASNPGRIQKILSVDLDRSQRREQLAELKKPVLAELGLGEEALDDSWTVSKPKKDPSPGWAPREAMVLGKTL